MSLVGTPHNGTAGPRRCVGCGSGLAADNSAALCGRCQRDRRDQFETPPSLSAEFFATDEFHAASRARHMGHIIKAYRNHPRHLRIYGKPLNQETIGRWLGGLTQGAVSRIEAGKPEQNLTNLIHQAEVLGLPDELLWFDLPGQTRKLEIVKAVEEIYMEAANESARLLQWAESNSIGDLTIEQINEEIRWISDNYLRAPTEPLFNRARALRNRISELLSQCRRPSKMMELYEAAGWCLSVLGWISTDIGASMPAKSHLRTAWACAENAESDNLRAWVRACEHTVHFWDKNYEAAAESAADGLRYAEIGSASLFLSSALALDLARLGDSVESTTALEDAMRAANSVSTRDDKLGGPFTCSVARATGFWSDVHLATGAADISLQYSVEAVRLFENTDPEKRNLGSERMARCQVVKSYLTLGEIDGAEEALSPILETEPENRVRPLMKRASEIASMTATLPNAQDKRVLSITNSISSFTSLSQISDIRARAKEIE